MIINEVTTVTKAIKQNVDFSRDDFDKIFGVILSRCSNIVSIYKNSPKRYLQRGFGLRTDKTGEAINAIAAFIGSIPTNRQPTDPVILAGSYLSYISGHDVSLAAYKLLGIQSTRKNSLFCTVNALQDYGDSYIIFPYDGFKFSYLEKYNNLTWYLQGEFKSKNASLLKFQEIKNKMIQNAVEVYKKYGLTADNLNKALNSPKKEVLISGKKYVAINSRYSKTITKWLESL